MNETAQWGISLPTGVGALLMDEGVGVSQELELDRKVNAELIGSKNHPFWKKKRRYG